MTSTRQVRANRINAQRSTGPRSRLGRLRSSRNSVTHGLSRPIDPVSVAPVLERLCSALLEELSDPRSAYEIALRILDYERNLERQRELHHKQVTGRSVDAIGIMNWVYEIDPQMRRLEEFAEGRLHPELTEDQESIREGAKFIIAQSRKRVARQVHYESRNAAESIRYLRRSSNQLIKALRRL
ncbi:MAG: hypothetical protein FJ184_11430 [Gammaproteobacteria bacterium]|nr:hypothetical protein [Gammaproteobacteria bacterium]